MKTNRNSFSILVIAISIICINSVNILAGGNSAVPPSKIADPLPFIENSLGREADIKPVTKREITMVELQSLVSVAIPVKDPNQTMYLGSSNGHFASAGSSRTTSQLTICKLNFK